MADIPDTSFEPVVPSAMPLLDGIVIGVAGTLIGGFVTLTTGALIIAVLFLSLIFPPSNEIERVTSPDGSLVLAVTEYDHGGLGGEVLVTVERASGGDWSRLLARAGWGARPSICWIDEHTVVIGGFEIDALSGSPVALDEP